MILPTRITGTGRMPLPLGANPGKHQNRTSNLKRARPPTGKTAGCRCCPRVATASGVRGRRAMLAAWIETPAKGRNGGPVRAGMWSAAVIGSHPVQDAQRAWLEVTADDLKLGLLPAYWIENKAGNSFWHAPIPP